MEIAESSLGLQCEVLAEWEKDPHCVKPEGLAKILAFVQGAKGKLYKEKKELKYYLEL